MTPNPDIPFRGIVEQSLAGMYVIQDEVFQYVNATFAAMLGYTPEEITGMHLRHAVYPEMQAETIANFHRRVSGEVPSIRYTTIGWHRNREPVYLEVHGSSVIYRGRPAVVGVGVNITEQRRQQNELAQSRERLRELAAYINTAREEQRARIARELHDVLGGMLTSIKLDIQRISRRSDDAGIKAIVGDLLQLTQESIDTVRSISEDLRPGGLDHLGLRSALEAELQRFSARTEIACQLVAEGFEAQLSPARATAVYRICQEALTNIARHAGASRVWIEGRSEDGAYRLTIEDDGRGMAQSGTRSDTPSFGLVSMRERAALAGGSLHIGSGRDGGVRVEVSLPLAGNKEDATCGS